MPSPSELAAFCLVASVLVLVPGPNFFYILTRGATQSRRAGMLAAFGLGAGVVVHTLLAAVGVAALIRASHSAFQTIKYGGSLYLIYLGVQAWRNGLPARSLREVSHDRIVLWESIVASLTNPKTILFFASVLPQFADPRGGPVSRQLMILGALYAVITCVGYGSLAFCAGSIGRWLDQRKRAAGRLRWITATSFIGLGVWAALPDRR